MNRQQGIQHLLKAQELFKEQSKGFQSWGRVEVQQVALKLTGNEFLLTDKKKYLRQFPKPTYSFIP